MEMSPFGAVRALQEIGVTFTAEQLACVKAYNDKKNADDAKAMEAWWSASSNVGLCKVNGKNVASKRQAENAQAVQTGKMLARSEMLAQLKRSGVPEHLWASIVK